MERLTTRNSMGVAVYKQPYECDNCSDNIWRLPDYGNGSPTDRLAKYEELEEQCIKETTWGFKELLYKWKVFLDDMADLVKYRQLEEQGLLLRLPSKEVYSSSGDTVYYIFDYEVAECINCGISIDCDGKMWIALACDEHIFPYRNPDPEHDLDPTDWCMNSTAVSVDEWGKTVFLTQEEAEKALKQMGE